MFGKGLEDYIQGVQKRAWEASSNTELAQKLITEIMASISNLSQANILWPNLSSQATGGTNDWMGIRPNNVSTEVDTGHIGEVNIKEYAEEMIISLALPGIASKEDLSLNLEGDALIIRGLYRNGQDPAGEKSSFRRIIRLPAEAAIQGASASYRNQYLTVSLPKKKHGSTKDIDVNFF